MVLPILIAVVLLAYPASFENTFEEMDGWMDERDFYNNMEKFPMSDAVKGDNINDAYTRESDELNAKENEHAEGVDADTVIKEKDTVSEDPEADAVIEEDLDMEGLEAEAVKGDSYDPFGDDANDMMDAFHGGGANDYYGGGRIDYYEDGGHDYFGDDAVIGNDLGMEGLEAEAVKMGGFGPIGDSPNYMMGAFYGGGGNDYFGGGGPDYYDGRNDFYGDYGYDGYRPGSQGPGAINLLGSLMQPYLQMMSLRGQGPPGYPDYQYN